RCGEHRHPATHAVTCEDEMRGVDAERFYVGRIAQECEHRICVVEVLREPEDAGTAPRSAVVECDRVPTGASHRLREIQVLLVARQPVQQHEGWMHTRTSCQIRDAIYLHAAGWDV